MEDMEKMIQAIYNLKCSGDCTDCRERHGSLPYCPKSYCDEYREAYAKLCNSTRVIKSVYKAMQNKPVLWYICDHVGTVQCDKRCEVYVWESEETAMQALTALKADLTRHGYGGLAHTLFIKSFQIQEFGKFTDGRPYIVKEGAI